MTVLEEVLKLSRDIEIIPDPKEVRSAWDKLCAEGKEPKTKDEFLNYLYTEMDKRDEMFATIAEALRKAVKH